MLTHFDENGNAQMVNVSQKDDTKRFAVAKGEILVCEEVYRAIIEKSIKKGDVLAVATTAGIMGAKRTFELIPMCHIIQLTGCSINWSLKPKDSLGRYPIVCTCRAESIGKTGVEMEALTGASTALLTVYDMVKAIDKTMEISAVRLIEKDGGKSGHIINT